jgi:hypothetical protein
VFTVPAAVLCCRLWLTAPRPLSPELLTYLVADVRYLPALVLLMERDLLQVCGCVYMYSWAVLVYYILLHVGCRLRITASAPAWPALVLLMERDLLQVWILPIVAS